VGVDHFVDFAHDADGFAQGNDDLLVMLDVLIGEDPTANFARSELSRSRPI